MKSVSTTMTFGTPEEPIRAEVTAWEDGSILVTVDGAPAKVDDVAAVAKALGWTALDGLDCQIVTEIPPQEVEDRKVAAAEQAALHDAAEMEQARAAAVAEPEQAPVSAWSVGACASCGARATGVRALAGVAVCARCLSAALESAP